MVLWTIQTEEAYQQLIQTGRLYGDIQHIDEDFIFAYDWLANEMIKRIGNPPTDVKYPVWAWYQCQGKRKKPDLRHSGYSEKGTPLVLLTVDIDEKDVLLSDFDDWHCVLNYFYLALNEKEDDLFHSRYAEEGYKITDLNNFALTSPCLEECRKQIEQSWQLIFDLNRNEPDWDTPLDKKSIQATFWELKKENVLKVQHFLAK
ncbi:MAG TPA: DUF3841 domain-containing protein [Ruminococcus flavefaciens]|nr:DUF3841 domain-containing protein [Ruminococcus flavefaciens]